MSDSSDSSIGPDAASVLDYVERYYHVVVIALLLAFILLPSTVAAQTPAATVELGHRIGNQHWDIAVEERTVYVPVEADREPGLATPVDPHERLGHTVAGRAPRKNLSSVPTVVFR